MSSVFLHIHDANIVAKIVNKFMKIFFKKLIFCYNPAAKYALRRRLCILGFLQDTFVNVQKEHYDFFTISILKYFSRSRLRPLYDLFLDKKYMLCPWWYMSAVFPACPSWSCVKFWVGKLILAG